LEALGFDVFFGAASAFRDFAFLGATGLASSTAISTAIDLKSAWGSYIEDMECVVWAG
jgi:hypothetical protein